mgnify:CR=1 FL=1
MQLIGVDDEFLAEHRNVDRLDNCCGRVVLYLALKGAGAGAAVHRQGGDAGVLGERAELAVELVAEHPDRASASLTVAGIH